MAKNTRRITQKRRYLRAQKLGKRSKKFFVFDTETGSLKNGVIEYFLSARPEHLLFGCVYGMYRGKLYKKVLHSAEEFRKEFKRRMYRGAIVYAHNAEYDLSAVYGNIYKLDSDAVFNGKFIACSNGVCTFADSFNLLPAKVEKLGELLNLPKLKLGGTSMKRNVADMWKDVEYCFRDCEIVFKSLQEIFADLEPSFTIGSLSLKLFRTQYLKKTIKVSPLADHFFEALYGGRTEAFYIGKCAGYVYDINSAYPDTMQKDQLPNCTTLKLVHPKSMKELEGLEGMIRAKVIVDDNEEYPALPVRHDNRLIFPVGKLRGSWTLCEFRYALKNTKMRLIEIESAIVSRPIASPFTDYITDNYRKRLATTNEFQKLYRKLFMNNLYGKLIQRAREDFHYCETQREAFKFIRDKKIKRAELVEVQDGFFVKYEKNQIFQHTIAPWGAYITSRVRIKLHALGKKYFDHLLYCDTDSNVLSIKLDLNSQQLGGWKREKKLITKIRALKDYVYTDLESGETNTALKGVKKDAVSLDEYANAFLQKRMVKTRESMRRIDNLPPGTFIQQMKFVSGDYKKRHVFKDGTTKPFKLNMYE